MAPAPFHDYLVSLVLQHMVPPGTTPLPAHLISSALASRHHLLQLTPSDAEYYCWPLTPALEPTHGPPARVVDALARLELEVLEDTALPVRYVPGGPQALVHVPLRGSPTTGRMEQLVLVFAWQQTDDDDDGEWRFHDARLFTGGHDPLDAGFATVDDALAARSPTPSDDNDSDAYWNGYAASEPTSHSPGSAAAAAAGPGSVGEDAYWARYDAERSTGHSPVPPPAVPVPVPAIVAKPGTLDADALANALHNHNTSGAPSPSPLDTNLTLPPAPAGTAPLDLLPSPTHPLHQHHAGTPQGLTLTLGTPPPSIPTVSAPLPTSPSIVHQSFVDKGKGRARLVTGSPVAGPSRLFVEAGNGGGGGGGGESALAINLNPASPSPLSSTASSAGAGARGVMPSPISPPASRANSIPTPTPAAALLRRGSHPLATSHTFSSSTSSVSSSSNANEDVEGALGETMRGLYRIWRATHSGGGSANGGGGEDDDRAAFLSFVARSLR